MSYLRPSVVPPVDADDVLDEETHGMLRPNVQTEGGFHIVKAFPRLAGITLLASSLLLIIILNWPFPSGSDHTQGIPHTGPSIIPECFGEAVHSCSAESKSSNLGEVANIGSVGTSGKLWKAEKKRSFEGMRFFRTGGGVESVKPKPHSRIRAACQHWAVITTIFPPTVLVKQLVAMRNWCTVVVGDKKAPSSQDYFKALPDEARSGGRFVYLTADDQDMLGYSITSKLRWNHFGRKNVGFLYAIIHGAELIYDTDDDNELLDTTGLSGWEAVMKSRDKTFPLFKTCHPYLNPYPKFGSRQQDTLKSEFLWPRGFPLDGMRDCGTMMEDTSRPAEDVPTSSIGVLQSLANHDPDVDAIYRLRHHLPIDFPSDHGPANWMKATTVVPPQTMAPFNAQATLFTQKAFWGLLLPISVHGRVSDIWRSYILQRLMWEVGLHVAFAEPWVQQIRNAHTYLADFQSELPLYLTAGGLVHFLLGWRPSSPITGTDGLLAATEELTIALYEIGVIELEDVELQQAWLSDLVAAGWSS